MKKKTAAFTTLLILAVSVLPCFAEGGTVKPYVLEDVLDQNILSELKEKGSIRYVHDSGEYELKLLPGTMYKSEALANTTERENGGYMTECLFLVDKETLEKNSTAGVQPVDTSITAAARILRSISKMQGMKYYSHLRRKVTVLYNKTYMVAGPEDDTPIPDKNTGSADGQICYAYQHDNSFGGCIYKVDYHQSDNEIYMVFNNLTSMKFGFIKAVDARQFKANMIVMNCGSQYLVYISTDANCPRIGIITTQINGAFNSRLDALYGWFISQF